MSSGGARREDSAVRVAKLGMLGAVAAAGITAIATLVPSLLDDGDGGGETTVPTSVVSPRNNGSVTAIDINDELVEVRVRGTADPSIERVYVMVGPDPVTGTFWTTGTGPSAQGEWEATLRVSPGPLPKPTKVAVIYDDGSVFPLGPPVTVPAGATLPEPDPAQAEADRIDCLQHQGVSCLSDITVVLTIDVPVD